MTSPESTKVGGGGDLATGDLAAAAEKLRQVKLATRRFLSLWALEHASDRLRTGDEVDAGAEAALADFVKHDWSALYDDDDNGECERNDS